MLLRVTIRNIVLIERCELAFDAGLCVLTGETGAGKSILLDALGLVLGDRSDAGLVRRGADEAQVTALFDITGQANAQAALAALGLEAENELLIRRTVTKEGKSRSFVNDVAVSVTGLRALGETLVEINGQHDGRGLLDSGTHGVLLDGYGELDAPLHFVRNAYHACKAARAALDALLGALESALRERDYLQHVAKELGELAPEIGEEDQLADARRTMMQREKLAATLDDTRQELQHGKGAAAMIASAQRILARSAITQDEAYSAAADALDRAATELGEADMLLERLQRAAEYSPAELERMEERLFALRAAARKHHATVDGLVAVLRAAEASLAQLHHGEQERATLEATLEQAQASYEAAAATLSAARAIAARALETAVAAELGSLKMSGTRFQVVQTPLPLERASARGSDAIQFEAATNAGSHSAALHKIASGGELSRFMLAMKVALAKVKSTPTLIFDEIDTGTGGAVADAIGKRLAALGRSHQVLVVTHLPQVAARGGTHFRIHKHEQNGVTRTEVERLSAEQRAEELARMLAGAEVTQEARQAAEKLLHAV